MKYFISGYGTGEKNTIAFMENTQLLWSSQLPNPSYLCETKHLLFAVGEFDDYCLVTSFQKTKQGYEQKDTIRLEGTCLCHLSAREDLRLLTGSCWGNGLFFILFYTEDGHFEKICYQEYQSDKTDHASRVHCAMFADDLIYVVNIELDFIYCYHLSDGMPLEISRLALPKGTGPRHLAFHPHKQLLYCITEYSSQMLTIDISNPKQLQVLSSLSLVSSDFQGTNTGSSLAITKDGKHLYGANRGENTIAHFLLDDNGMPHFSDRTTCHGNWPRHIALLDNDTYLGIANQFSGDVVFLKREQETGILSKTPDFTISHEQASFIAEAISTQMQE